MYVNYGDKNFFEYGCLVDEVGIDEEYSIIVCRPISDRENYYIFAVCDVDITDTWIDRDNVLSFIGMSELDFDPIQFAIGCTEYYALENFTASNVVNEYTKDEVLNELNLMDIDLISLGVDI